VVSQSREQRGARLVLANNNESQPILDWSFHTTVSY
jgi:hypothetical protein